MATLTQLKDKFLLSIQREILFIDTSDHQHTRLWINLPPVPVKPAAGQSEKTNTEEAEGEDPSVPDCPADDEQAGEAPVDGQFGSNHILQVAISPESDLLAVTTADEKALYLYRLSDDQEPELLSRRELSRTSNVIRFNNAGTLLYLADKTGDCYTYDCTVELAQAPAKWTLAHLSMVLDIVPSACSKYVVTSDRDEKIRCTHIPRSTVIQSYCLGHTEYVPAIALLPTRPLDTLISVSGDKTLRVWEFLEGKQLASLNLPASVLKMAVRQVNDLTHVAVAYYNHQTTLEIYSAQCTGDSYKFERISEHALDVKGVTSVMFDHLGELIVATVTQENQVQAFRFTFDGLYKPAGEIELNDAIRRVATSLDGAYNVEADDLLFKKKFDNIHDYKERKKMRIEDKNTKTNVRKNRTHNSVLPSV